MVYHFIIKKYNFPASFIDIFMVLSFRDAVRETCGLEELRCGGVVMWGIAVWGVVGELRCGGVAVWGSCSVGELRCEGVAVWVVVVWGELQRLVVVVWGVAVLGSCSVGELQCGGFAVWGSCGVGEF